MGEIGYRSKVCTCIFTTHYWIGSFFVVKTNIEVIPDALEKVKKLSGYTFNRTDTKHEVKQTGVIAQEVMEVLPEAVNGDDEGGYSVAYGNMAGILIEAIKEQQTQIEDLNDKVNTLEKLMKDILGK